MNVLIFCETNNSNSKNRDIHTLYTRGFRERRYNKAKTNTKSKTFETITRFRMMRERTNRKLMQINNHTLYQTLPFSGSDIYTIEDSNESHINKDDEFCSYTLNIWQSDNF